MGGISCKCETIAPKANTELTTGPTEETPRYSDNRKEIGKIKIIQAFYRGYRKRKHFNEERDALSIIVYLDLAVNVIKNPMVINNNQGEKISQKLEKEGKIQPYQRKDINHSKFVKDSDLTYIDKYKNDDMYIGTWSMEKKFKGYGILYRNNTKFEGIWDNGLLNGQGRYFLPTGDYFEGNFVKGIAKGHGIYHHEDGNIYDGNWHNDQPDGQGGEIFKDGSIFEGWFVKGKKVRGVFKWIDGSSYNGEIKNELFEGQGTFKWKEGREYQGQWKEGLMNGKGLLKFQDGSVYEGYFFQGKRSGYGKYTWNVDKYYEGDWLDGKQHGQGTYVKGNITTKGVWSNGKLLNLNGNLTTPTVSGISQTDTACLNFISEKCNIKPFTKINNLKKNLFNNGK